MAQIFANAIIRLAILLMGNVPGDQVVNLVGDLLVDNTIPPPPHGLCRMSLLGRHYDEPPMPGAPLQQCSITVQCDDSHTNFYEFSNATWDGCKLESTHHVSDPQIGDFDIYFSTPSDANSAFAFPFPGHPVLISERYKLSRSEGMDLRTCVNLQETHSYFEGKDCKGNDIQAIICAGSFGDRKAGVKSNKELAKRGWAYHVAFPRIDRDPKEC